MTEFTINVNVGGCAKIELGVSPQLEQVLTRLLGPKVWEMPREAMDSLRVRSMMETQELNLEKMMGDRIAPQEPTTENAQQLLDELKNQCDAAAQEQVPNTTIGELPSLLNQEPPVGEPLTLEEITPPAEPETFNDPAMRKIMEDTRERLFGCKSPENKKHPLYKRLNGQFKTEASFASKGQCDTPSRLPELGYEYCIAFRNACEGLAIDPVTNDIISKPPF